MLRILDVRQVTATKYEVTVRPNGAAAADGKLLTAAMPNGAKTEVGTWSAPDADDGTGTANTGGGGWLFASQGADLSEPFPLPVIVPNP